MNKSIIIREIETNGYAQTYNKDMAEYCRENGYRVEEHDGKFCIWKKWLNKR